MTSPGSSAAPAGEAGPTGVAAPPPPAGRPGWVWAGVAGAVAVLLLAAIAAFGWQRIRAAGDAEGGAAAPAPAATVDLRDSAADAMASCLAATPETLRTGSDLAFVGTVREVDENQAVFAVERWFTGGAGASAVRLERVQGQPGLLYTPDLRAGDRYLITASGGALRPCDPSGPWSTEAEQLYVAAFGAGTPVG